eukprot:3193110-Prymnesium_polylepis.3
MLLDAQLVAAAHHRLTPHETRLCGSGIYPQRPEEQRGMTRGLSEYSSLAARTLRPGPREIPLDDDVQWRRTRPSWSRCG